MDVDSIRKPYYQLRGIFTCESREEITERQILYLYYIVQKRKMPYVFCDSCLHHSIVHMGKLVANKMWKETGFARLVDKLDGYWNY